MPGGGHSRHGPVSPQVASESASRVTTLSEKPSACMPMKAGITDSGNATAETKVARQSRRNSHTTITASIAPS